MDTAKMTQIRKTTVLERYEATRAYQDATNWRKYETSAFEKIMGVVAVVFVTTVVAAIASPLLAFVAAGIAGF
jgi:hypothetical protein